MNKYTHGLLLFSAIASTAFAGQEIQTGTESKGTAPMAPTCFGDHEWQVDLAGDYVVGKGNDHAGPIREHAWGGSADVNYFFTKYIGFGVTGAFDTGYDNSAQPRPHDFHRHDEFNTAAGNVIFRLPIDRICLAPYVFAGGGGVFDTRDWAFGYVGFGTEYRIVPQKVGIFADARWNYFGDRFERGDENNFTIRAGVRVVF